MKKLIVAAFLAVICAQSCSKKESSYQQDSNTMLTEPETAPADSANVTKPAANMDAAKPAVDTSATAAKTDTVK